MEITEIINKYFKNIDDNKLHLLNSYFKLLIYFNEQVNLISRNNTQQNAVRQMQHSLVIAKYTKFENVKTIVDLGTGGGLPGIPLAIFFPEIQFYLVDSIQKKLNVVAQICKNLELKNVTIVCDRIENTSIQADVVVTKAVAKLNKLVVWSNHLFANKAQHIIALKGGDLTEEIKKYKKKTKLTLVSNYFKEDYFENKFIVEYKA